MQRVLSNAAKHGQLQKSAETTPILAEEAWNEWTNQKAKGLFVLGASGLVTKS